MANSISNNDNLTIGEGSLGAFCHTSLQDTLEKFNDVTTVTNLGAAFTASSATPGGTDNNKLWVKLDSTDSNPLGFWFHETTRGWEQFLSTPSGASIQFAGSAAPDGWLLCDGSDVSQTTYARLYAVIQSTYGTAADSTNDFKLPDLRGRVAVGVDGSAARLASNDALAESGGAETHTLALTEIPEHTHVPPTTSGYNDTNNNETGLSKSGTGYSSSNAHAGNMTYPDLSAVTGGGAHNNLQPYLIVNHIIKT